MGNAPDNLDFFMITPKNSGLDIDLSQTSISPMHFPYPEFAPLWISTFLQSGPDLAELRYPNKTPVNYNNFSLFNRQL